MGRAYQHEEVICPTAAREGMLSMHCIFYTFPPFQKRAGSKMPYGQEDARSMQSNGLRCSTYVRMNTSAFVPNEVAVDV